ncbi:MAG: SUMF1/EgtB/PvdO family nonheme iron enzyme [Treponema sp.]|jgi:uncharacterized repeat protein (TIGR02543 family)|nr:SUMF1/EgtB/PvdO family nonheme iron enzyme [Treponema sp.]
MLDTTKKTAHTEERPFSVLRSPFSVLRSPFSVLRSPFSLIRRNFSLSVFVLIAAVFSLVACPSSGGDGGGDGDDDIETTYTVTFAANDSGDGTSVTGLPSPITGVTSGEKIAQPNSNPERADFIFDGWYTEAAGTNAWNFAADTVTANITLYAKWIAPGDLMIRTLSGVAVKFRYVPGGKFQRNSTAGNVSIITKGYWLGETEVTQELFQAIMQTNPSHFTNAVDGEDGTPGKLPVEQVSWYDAIAFCNKLSIADRKQPVYSVDGINDWSGSITIPISNNTTWDAATQDLSKNGYRLPTEMEWMWAAMGADKTAQPNTSGYNKAFAGSNGSNSIGDYAWYYNSYKTHKVGQKTANELNLSDMSGNVWEWVWDWADSYPNGERTDFTGPASGSNRVLRGGSWNDADLGCKVAYRDNYDVPRSRYNHYGFRVLVAAQ